MKQKGEEKSERLPVIPRGIPVVPPWRVPVLIRPGRRPLVLTSWPAAPHPGRVVLDEHLVRGSLAAATLPSWPRQLLVLVQAVVAAAVVVAEMGFLRVRRRPLLVFGGPGLGAAARVAAAVVARHVLLLLHRLAGHGERGRESSAAAGGWHVLTHTTTTLWHGSLSLHVGQGRVLTHTTTTLWQPRHQNTFL